MQIKRGMNEQQGSALVLTLLAVLILSALAITGLTVSSTEVESTQNFYLNKRAYYTALHGVEEVRNEIYRKPDPEDVIAISKCGTETQVGTGSSYTLYITGSMDDLRLYLESSVPPPVVDFFQGFNPPPLPAIGLGGTVAVAPVVWSVRITSCVSAGKKKSYSEIESGVYSIVSVGY